MDNKKVHHKRKILQLSFIFLFITFCRDISLHYFLQLSHNKGMKNDKIEIIEKLYNSSADDIEKNLNDLIISKKREAFERKKHYLGKK